MKNLLIVTTLLVSFGAYASETFDGSQNLVIGYLPVFTQEELEDPMSGAGSAVEHRLDAGAREPGGADLPAGSVPSRVRAVRAGS